MDRLLIEMMSMVSVMLSAMTGLGTIMIAIVLTKFWRVNEAQRHAERVERTLKALQLPENVSDALGRVLWMQHQELTAKEEELWESGVFSALDFFENLAAGIREGVYDERISYNRLGDALPRFYGTVAGALYRHRGEGLSPSLYVDLEGLVRSWKGRSSSSVSMGP